MLTETPRYRVVAPVVFINGGQYSEGVEIDFLGWPKAFELEPLNEAARRVSIYRAKHSLQPWLPKVPHNALVGAIYLPATFPPTAPPMPNSDPGIQLPSPVSEADASDDMPRYRATAVGRVGRAAVAAGEEFNYLGWPASTFQPVNAPAYLVWNYHEANKNSTALLPSPWCCFKQGLVLPALPDVPHPLADPSKLVDPAKDGSHHLASAGAPRITPKSISRAPLGRYEADA